MAMKYLSTGQSFQFPRDFGFTGSSAGRADAKPHRDAGPDEYGDGLAAKGPKAKPMAKGGPVKKQIGGGVQPPAAPGGAGIANLLSNPIARAAAQQTAGALAARQGAAPAMVAPMGTAMRPAMSPAIAPAGGPGGMAKGGKFIQGMHLKKGALHRQLNVPEDQKIPAAKMAAAASGKYGALAEKRAHTAKTLKSFGK
jgi:hypothetical protein